MGNNNRMDENTKWVNRDNGNTDNNVIEMEIGKNLLKTQSKGNFKRPGQARPREKKQTD